jgi:hypothetical protein
VMVRADVSGDYVLEFETIGAALPEADSRTLHLGTLLAERPFK